MDNTPENKSEANQKESPKTSSPSPPSSAKSKSGRKKSVSRRSSKSSTKSLEGRLSKVKIVSNIVATAYEANVKTASEVIETPVPEIDQQEDRRNMRRIYAEDPEYSLATVPLLLDLCIKNIVDNFLINSGVIENLPKKDREKVLDRLPTNLPLYVIANLIHEENFWKRCCKEQLGVRDVSQTGFSWKRMFFETHLESAIEKFEPGRTEVSVLDEIVRYSAEFVQKLDIRQLMPPVKIDDKQDGENLENASDAGEEEPEIDHFDFNTIIDNLPFLNELHITYGIKDCGMNFEWNLFQFTNRDCLYLARCIASCSTLKLFRLHRSRVDDDKCRVLISNILDHPTLECLDLSHNVIGDRGGRAIGKLLNQHSILTTLNLCDNRIRPAGAQAIAHALTKNTTLRSLNLRLNRLSDEGGLAICKALQKNQTLENLNLASNELTEPTANSFSQVVAQNESLIELDLSCNRLGNDGGKQLQEGMETNNVILRLDLRLTECGQESEYCINQILNRNREREREIRLKRDNALYTGRF